MKPDQAELLELYEKACADLAAAQELLANNQATLDRVAKECEEYKAKIALLIAERDEAIKGSETLQASLAEANKLRAALAAENEILKLKMIDFNKAVAEVVAKCGISHKTAEARQTAEKPLTATEKCLAAKGK